MAATLDLSLDEVIAANRKSGGGRGPCRGAGRSAGRGRGVPIRAKPLIGKRQPRAAPSVRRLRAPRRRWAQSRMRRAC